MSLRASHLEVRRGRRCVLRDVSLSLHPGELLALVGPNGAGKSTLISALGAELSPGGGEVTLDGTPISRMPLSERARRLAVLPQEPGLRAAFRVHEVVALGRSPHAPEPMAHTQRAVRTSLLAAGVEALAERPYLALSGGERQRVQLARVLAQLWSEDGDARGKVLLLDEPTASLDLSHQHRTLRAARTLCEQGGAALAAVHDLNLAARWADKVAVLRDGALVALGPPSEVLSARLLSEVFDTEVHVSRHPLHDGPWVAW